MEESWDVDFRNITKFWVYYVFLPVVVLVGVIGNSLTLFILTRRQMRISSKKYLLALILSDMLVLVFTFSVSWENYAGMQAIWMYWNYVPYGIWITNASRYASSWLTVCLTIERYFAVCYPMLLKLQRTQDRATAVTSVVSITTLLLTAPTSLEWNSIAKALPQNDASNQTVFVLEYTDLGSNFWFRLIYNWFTIVFFVALPFIMLSIGNILLIRAVKISQETHGNLAGCDVDRYQSRRWRQGNRIAVNLSAITVVFFICQIPTAVYLIDTSIKIPEKESTAENVLVGVGHISDLFVAINAVCNFMLHVTVSDKYRQVFRQIVVLNTQLPRWYRGYRPPGLGVLRRVPFCLLIRYLGNANGASYSSQMLQRSGPLELTERIRVKCFCLRCTRKCESCKDSGEKLFSLSFHVQPQPATL